jgi:urease accessory protein
LTGLDHLLALLGVGLWSRQQVHAGHGAMGMPAFLAPVFLALMALGASTGLAPPALETSVAATVLLLGVLAASGGRLAPSVALLLAGGCGFLHGLAHGHELAGLDSGAGFLLTSSLVMAAGAGIGTLAGPPARRLLGAAIGTAGLCLLAGVV